MVLLKNKRAPLARTGYSIVLFLSLASFGSTCLSFSTQLMAQTLSDDLAENANGSSTVFQEREVKLPAMFKPADLLPFDDSGASRQRFAIDKKSVEVGKDGVVRYTLVSVSSSGAQNISFEGIRCQTYERKIYASGRPDGSWSIARNSQWTPIRVVGLNRQHASLAQDYFCDSTTVSGNAADMINRIARQARLQGELTN